MAVRQIAASEAAGTLDGPSASPPGAGQPDPVMLSAERLDYIAEIAEELEGMAEQAGCATLAGLLGLARREAKLRRQG